MGDDGINGFKEKVGLTEESHSYVNRKGDDSDKQMDSATEKMPPLQFCALLVVVLLKSNVINSEVTLATSIIYG